MSNESSGYGSDAGKLASKIGAIGWGIFFIWLAVLFLGGLRTSVGLFGIAGITLSMQLVRRSFGLPAEGFWLVVGLVFLLAGIWEATNPGLPLISVVLFLVGAALLASVLGRKS